jgi:S-formylglutathione hydrolase
LPEDLITLSKHACFGGAVSFHEHRSETCDATMRFAVYAPPQAERPVPVLYYLADLTSTEEYFIGAVVASWPGPATRLPVGL